MATGSGKQHEERPPPHQSAYSGSVDSQSTVGSEDSYWDIPLLERGLDYDCPRLLRKDSQTLPMVPAVSDDSGGSSKEEHSNAPSDRASFDVIEVSDSLKCISPRSTQPHPIPKGPSHLSSTDAMGACESKDQVGQESTESATGMSLSETYFEIPPHPLAQPPSPPMSTPNGDTGSLSGMPVAAVGFQAPPLTPDVSPQIENKGQEYHDQSDNVQHVSSNVLKDSESDYRQEEMQHAEHVPFILACESHILAQQLTLVEIAALSEIDWKDLIDMKWDDASTWTSSWVNFLFDDNRRGIDLVVGRFNLMVKWAQSEIVLTRDMDMRAQTISKLIHTAAHAKSMCNYSTTLQICIALSSSVCSCLKKTWVLVPPSDKRLLRDIEAMTRPVRNFHDLREEMETANLQEGCIPFVGKTTLPFVEIRLLT